MVVEQHVDLTGYSQRGRPARVAGAQRRRIVGDSSRNSRGFWSGSLDRPVKELWIGIGAG